MTVLALVPAVLPDADGAARLEALLDEEFLAGAGWDARALILSPPASHPELGWPVCQVPGGASIVIVGTVAGSSTSSPFSIHIL